MVPVQRAVLTVRSARVMRMEWRDAGAGAHVGTPEWTPIAFGPGSNILAFGLAWRRGAQKGNE
jgi:hypothetical protein